MKPLTLSGRLYLVTAVAILPALGILISSIVLSQRENSAALHQQAARTAELAALEMERVISGAENVLRTLSITPIVRRGDPDTCSRLVTDMAAAVPSLSAIAVINPDGHSRCTTVPAALDLYLGDRDYFQEALAQQDRVVGTFIVERATQRNVLPVALRIGGGEGAPLGVAVAYIDLDWLEARLLERTVAPGSSLTIADRDGTILARVPEPERFVGTTIPDDYQHLLHLPDPGTIELTSQDGTRRVLGYVPITFQPKGLYISAGFSTELAFASTDAIFSSGVAIGLFGLVAAFLLATYTSRVYVERPVKTLVDTVRAWRAGNTAARTGMLAKDGEIGGAGQNFDEFVEELLVARKARAASEERLQTLLAELDHRGKNFLSMIQAVARQTFSRTASEMELRVFSNRLKAMGDANSMLRQAQWHSAPVHSVVQTAVSPFVDPASTRIRLSGPRLALQSDVVLPLSMALHELCTNAAKYGALAADEGVVSIDWDLKPDATQSRFELVWREQGGPPVSSPKKKGFGTTVIEKVLPARTGGDVTLSYEPDGLVCRMSFPARNGLAGYASGSAPMPQEDGIERLGLTVA